MLQKAYTWMFRLMLIFYCSARSSDRGKCNSVAPDSELIRSVRTVYKMHKMYFWTLPEYTTYSIIHKHDIYECIGDVYKMHNSDVRWRRWHYTLQNVLCTRKQKSHIHIETHTHTAYISHAERTSIIWHVCVVWCSHRERSELVSMHDKCSECSLGRQQRDATGGQTARQCI